MPALPTQSDLELIIGADNVRQWADVDNDGDVNKRKARIAWALNEAHDYIVGRLAQKFDITTFVSYPSIIFQLIAKRACIELNQSPRGLVDGDAANAGLNSISSQIEAKLDQILAGMIKVIDAPSQTINTPEADNCGAVPWQSLQRQQQWSGDPCVTDYGRFYSQ